MNESAYRSIFPDNNIPKINVKTKVDNSFEDNIYLATLFLSQYADFSKINLLVKEIEFKHMVENNPAEALLKKLQEFSENTNKEWIW